MDTFFLPTSGTHILPAKLWLGYPQKKKKKKKGGGGELAPVGNFCLFGRCRSWAGERQHQTSSDLGRTIRTVFGWVFEQRGEGFGRLNPRLGHGLGRCVIKHVLA
jgi:hypothetical protein